MKASGQLHAMTALLLGKNPGMQCIGGWVGLRTYLGVFGKGKIFFPYQDSNSGSCNPQTSCYTAYAFPASEGDLLFR